MEVFGPASEIDFLLLWHGLRIFVDWGI